MKTRKSVVAVMVQVLFIISMLCVFSGAAVGACISFTFEKQETTPLTGTSVGTKNIIRPSVVDIDGNGSLDVVVTSGQNGSLYIIKNSDTSPDHSNPAFATSPVVYNLGIGDNYITAGFTYVNEDDLPDLFVSVGSGISSSLKTLRYFENITTGDTIQFAEKTNDTVNPFKEVEIHESLPLYGFPMSFPDLDDDGQADAVFGIASANMIGNILFFKKPENQNLFVKQADNPFSCIVSNNSPTCDFKDIDGDDDLDLIVGLEKALKFYENTGTKENPQFVMKDTEGGCLSDTYYCPVYESGTKKHFCPAFTNFGDSGILSGTLSTVEFEYWKVSFSNKNPGDIDSKNGLTLADAILGLKILASADISGETVNLKADVNADGIIGQEEVIFVLREIAQVE